MDREIKFRAWDKIQKVMLYYDKDVVPLLTLNGVLVDAGITGHSTNVSYRFILEQYTGLKDKQGKEAYADDRIDTPRFDSPFVIKWDDFRAKYYMQSEQNNHIIDMRFLPEEGEIIGNIHDEVKDD